MIKKQTSKEIAMLFADKTNNDNLISQLFDYLQFDCFVRAFIDFNKLDDSINKYFESKTVEALIPVIDLILEGKELAAMEEKTFLKNIKSYILEHLAEAISVEEIAGVFHISYYYLCHLFKKFVKKSVHQYRTEKRLEKAIRMLIETNDKISDIAVKCGFDNFSYFTEVFSKNVGTTPSELRAEHTNCYLHPFYEYEDMLLAIKMDSMRFISDEINVDNSGVPYVKVHEPGEQYGLFLHEAAIIEYEGVLYASWYNCKETELSGNTPIVGRRSYDGGKTWTSPEIIAKHNGIGRAVIYCPPVYGICDGKLYMLINEMTAADHIHALDLYVLNKESGLFEFVWSRPIPFKLNTNVVTLPNGKLMLPGRIAELDAFPNTPAVMISDSGKIDAPWRVVKVAPNGDLPDGSSLVHPETTVLCCDDVLYLFNRNDVRCVPLVYVSKDFGETWSAAASHDIPYFNSKIYGGMLSDGRLYLIANVERQLRTKLVLYVSEKGKLNFTRQKVLIDCAAKGSAMLRCHYPAATESDGKLYVIATSNFAEENMNERGAVLFTVDLQEI